MKPIKATPMRPIPNSIAHAYGLHIPRNYAAYWWVADDHGELVYRPAGRLYPRDTKDRADDSIYENEDSLNYFNRFIAGDRS